MAEIFYGPWRVVQYQPYSSPYLRQSLVITGSENADGRYLLEYFNPVDITVLGTEWSLTVEKSDVAESDVWDPITPTVQLVVRSDTGLTRLLDIPFANDPGGQSLAIELACTCLDETINPPRRPNPYDFTYMPD